jgi:hypothetical protein
MPPKTSTIDTSGFVVGPQTIAALRQQLENAVVDINAIWADIDALQTEIEEPTMDQPPIPLVAGNGGASALLDISAASGKRCWLTSEGPIKVRFGASPVTATLYHMVLPGAGTSPIFTVPASIVELSAWGDGGAWPFCLVPLE